MSRAALRCLVSIGGLWSMLGCAPEVHAQSARTPSFGFWMGGATVPGGLDPGCGYSRGRDEMLDVGAFVVVPTGPVALEGRVAGHSGAGRLTCAGLLLYQPGVRTERVSALPSGGFPAIDLRVRWLPTDGEAVKVAAGAGWAGGSNDIPYLSASVGGRMPAGGARIGVDLELTAYRLPWIERTVEATETGELETSRRTFAQWAPALGLMLGAEFPIGGSDPP